MKEDAALDKSLAGRQRQLETLDRLAQKFGASLSGALTRNASEGRRLDTVLDTVGRTLLRATLRAAMRPLQRSLTSFFSSLATGGGVTAAEGAAPTALARGGVVSRGMLLPLAKGGVVSRGMVTPFAQGGVISRQMVTPFAQGGVVAAPTYFPLGRGLGLMGEQGAEAVMPLARGPDGRLGVRAGGAATRPIAVTVNVTTPDADSFRRSEAQVSAALARAVARGKRGL